jgi:O-antigen ligase
MIRQSIRISFRPNDLLSQIIVGCMGLILGIACIWFSPLLVLGAVVVATFIIYATLKRLHITLLGILIATSSIVFEERLPLLSVGSISFHVPDILLLGSLGLITVRWLVVPEFRIVRTPLDRPLLIFYGVTLLSTFIAILQSSVEVKEALRATRVLTYYLTFFIVTNLVRERRQLNFLLNSIIFLATIVAAGMIGQFLLGDSVELLPGRVEALNTQGTTFEAVTRISPPGFSIVLVSFVTILCTVVLEKLKPIGLLKFVQCGLLGMALLITFLRSYWAVLIVVIFLVVYLVRGIDRQRLIGWGMVVISSAALILLVVFNGPNSRASKLGGAFLDRLSTLGSIGTFQGQDSSVDWRKIENGYAFSAIASNPLIGLGMGARYRPWDSRLDSKTDTYDFRRHIHNGHLWILLQSGLLGYLSLMWLSVVFLMRGFRYWRSIPDDRMRGVVLGFTLVYLAVLIAAVTNSSFMQWRWTPVIGIIMGINEVILGKVGQGASVA